MYNSLLALPPHPRSPTAPHRRRTIPPQSPPAQGFVAAVGLGLDKFQGAEGARELCESLSKKYASEPEGAPQQLAMLFSLLPPEVQPVPVVKSLLVFPTGSASGFRSVRSSAGGEEDLDLESIFGESPSALLPEELRPRFDEGAKAFFVPGVPRLASESDAELAFGARGPFPTSKVSRRRRFELGIYLARAFLERLERGLWVTRIGGSV